MRVCVTGATGFIGRYICDRLARDGHSVVGTDLIKPDGDQRLDEFVQADIRDPAAMRRVIGGCDWIFSLAAAHHDFGIDEPTYYAVNEQASRVICDEADRAGIGRICWYSSCAVYGNCPAPRHEGATPQPINPYGASKLAGERVFREWAGRGGSRSALVMRPTITFGPGNVANMYSLISQVSSGRFVVAGKATNYKSLSYVENLVDATMHLWAQEPAGFTVTNFIDKPDLTSREIAQAVADALGRPRPGPNLPMPLVLAMAMPFDAVTAVTGKDLGISSMRVKKLFSMETRFEADALAKSGFRSAVPLREGIARMVRWWKQAGSSARPKWRQPPAQVQTF